MDVLLVKTSSLGDVVHTLPAVTDARRAIPDIRFHWVVEEAFADLPARHPAVAEVIPVAIRRWRKTPVRSIKPWREFKKTIRQRQYDLVIDAQGLVKSALITRLAHGPKHGLDKQSAREPWAARVLDYPHAIGKQQHAITRTRQLFAQALGYSVPDSLPDAGLSRQQENKPLVAGSQLIFFHGTTWKTKHWPETYWQTLINIATRAGMQVYLPWGNDVEKARAERLTAGVDGANVLPRLSLTDLFDKLLALDGFVAVDTGLAHLAAAAGLAGVALYGPTDPSLTGVIGLRAKSLTANFPCAPCKQKVCTYEGAEKSVFPACFSSLPPEKVWDELRQL